MIQRRPLSASPWRVMGRNIVLLTAIWSLLAWLVLQSRPALCDFDGPESIHHLFNAHLLEPKEIQVSLFGNAQTGVTKDLELGVQGLGYLMKTPIWNISLKHRMFTEPNFQTSFNSHSFFFQSDADHLLLSLHGIITSYAVQDHHQLNFGLMDGLFMAFNHDSASSLHLVTPMIGWDGVLNSHLAFSATLLRPVYAAEEQDSKIRGDGNRRLNFTHGSAHPAFGMATAILAFGSFHVEFGTLYLSYNRTLILPYANLFWRFHG